MNSNKHLPISTLVAALFLSAVTVCSSFGSELSESNSKAMQSMRASTDSSLKKGMSAREVEQLLGKPAEIKPMNAPSGKAEVWIYRERKGEVSKQIQVGSKPITIMVKGPDGVDRQQVISEEIIYKMQNDITEETLSLLIFNGQFIEKKVTTGVRREFL
jgi:outer membrane protein assembly factor BamE (lipoprotein component of BamABCDE complex)